MLEKSDLCGLFDSVTSVTVCVMFVGGWTAWWQTLDRIQSNTSGRWTSFFIRLTIYWQFLQFKHILWCIDSNEVMQIYKHTSLILSCRLKLARQVNLRWENPSCRIEKPIWAVELLLFWGCDLFYYCSKCFTLYTLAGQFILTSTILRWEAFSRAANIVQRLFVHIFSPLFIPR